MSVHDNITSLLRLSMSVRNPTPHDQFMNSQQIDTSSFEAFDIRHTREKFPSAPESSVINLGKAISRRRGYFIYREAQGKKLPSSITAESYQYRPPIDLWQGDRGGFQERLAAANYSFPPPQRSAFATEDYRYPYATSISLDKSSMAPSNQPPLQSHNSGPSTYAGGSPSVEYHDTSYAGSSVDTELGKPMAGVRLLEEKPEEVLVRPKGGVAATVYECTFGFLGCRFFTTEDEVVPYKIEGNDGRDMLDITE
ncbi:hypothetical protein GTA08_BOTSDO05173 [Botryosphaeria dothidea]|uniref:Uncharacterized protein n=1 Tax=Botryosphaeria dothidea TaxID=55169 RepID=A0A8H4ITZ0_9PEZI|nr:hypothetical protein GTA08_BOTSDO05173 [Botryosphaeria dothidea]